MCKDKQTASQTLSIQKRPKLCNPAPAPALLVSHVIAAPEEPSDWWVLLSIKLVSLKDERRLLVVFLETQVGEVVVQPCPSYGTLLFTVT